MSGDPAFRSPPPPWSRAARAARAVSPVGVISLCAWLSGAAAGLGTDHPRWQVDARQVRDGWSVGLSPGADLWFHGMAVVGARAAGPSYSASYVAAIQVEKERMGVYPTRLDELSERLGNDIAGDVHLEILHLVPLYFHRVGAIPLLDALEAVARRRSDDPALSDVEVRFGAAVMFEAIQTSSQRRLLRSFVDALREEWEVFYRDYWERYRASEEGRIVGIQRRWDVLAGDLAGFLRANGLDQGTLILSPPLGDQGRLFADRPGGSIGTLLSVHLPLEGEDVHVPLYSAVKALCFTVVQSLGVASRGGQAARDAQQTRAGVRCGAMVLEFQSPALVAGYRRFSIQSAGVDVSLGTTARAFEETFPLDPEVAARIREAVRRR